VIRTAGTSSCRRNSRQCLKSRGKVVASLLRSVYTNNEDAARHHLEAILALSRDRVFILCVNTP
jgi:hypothetical protein